MVSDFLYPQSEDILISSPARKGYFDIDKGGLIHFIWEKENDHIFYGAVNDSGEFIYSPLEINDFYFDGFNPFLRIKGDTVACIWTRRHKPPLVDFSTYIGSVLIKNGNFFSNLIKNVDDADTIPNDAHREYPEIIWHNDTTLYAVWSGLGSQSWSNPFTDIYYKKLFINPYRRPFVFDRIINNSKIQLGEQKPSIIKKKNSEGYIIIMSEQDSIGFWNITSVSVDDSLQPNRKKVIIKEKIKITSSFMAKPAVLQRQNGNYIIIWEEDKTDTSAFVYFKELSEEGVSLSEIIKANDSQAYISTDVVASMDSSGNFIIAWEDGKNIKAQRFYSDLDKRGSIFQVNRTSALRDTVNIYPRIRLYNGKIYTSWTSSGKNYLSVWMNIRDFDNPVGVDEGEKVNLPKEFVLLQNYPNPFNPTTSIKYSLPEQEFVSLKIFDILGNEVATLVNESKPAGNYEVQFDANNLSSGVYFYQLRAGNFTETKKLILMK